MDSKQLAPGAPGILPRWTSSAKTGVGTAIGSTSRVWFTLSHGILNEIYYPRVDMACTRDMGLIVTAGKDFFSEEKRNTHSEVAYLADGVPAYRLTNTCEQGRYQIEKEVIADPQRSVVLQRIRFTALHGELSDYRVFVLLAPHLGNCGLGNNGWLGTYKGVPMLFARRNDSAALALACSAPWRARSVGFVGTSDGWLDVSQHGQLTQQYTEAEDGNIALTAEIDLRDSDGSFVLALGFDSQAFSAAHHVRASLFDGFDLALQRYIAGWTEWQGELENHIESDQDHRNLYCISAAVLHTHESKDFSGGLIASLSIPWGMTKGDDELGGYHLAWTRDLVETVGGQIAAGADTEVIRVLRYLQTTQEPEGHWPQNMWLDGTPFWDGVQMDEAGFPILLAARAWRTGMLNDDDLVRFWPMIRAAVGFIVRNGPVTQLDRWEENAGYSPFTLAVEVSAVLVAAEFAEQAGEAELAIYLRETADAWNASIERWTYVIGTPLAQQVGVDGYYVRIAPPEAPDTVGGLALTDSVVSLKNLPDDAATFPTWQIVSPDALALVRFGLRGANDPRIVNTVKVIDATLKVETPHGPAWHRYNHDGYGEHADGAAYDGTGIGRAWPLLTGERAHYELAADHPEEAQRLCTTFEAFANQGCMFPEQIWDTNDIPERELFFGCATGSAMPLVWAHAEYLKLRHSLQEGCVFDMPPQTAQRYVVDQIGSPHTIWSFDHQSCTLPAGKILRIEVLASARVHWSSDSWQTSHDSETRDTGLGMFVVDLPTTKLPADTVIDFTFHWLKGDRWEGTDFAVHIGAQTKAVKHRRS